MLPEILDLRFYVHGTGGPDATRGFGVRIATTPIELLNNICDTN